MVREISVGDSAFCRRCEGRGYIAVCALKELLLGLQLTITLSVNLQITFTINGAVHNNVPVYHASINTPYFNLLLIKDFKSPRAEP